MMRLFLTLLVLLTYILPQSMPTGIQGWKNETFVVPDTLYVSHVFIDGGAPTLYKVLVADANGVGTWQDISVGAEGDPHFLADVRDSINIVVALYTQDSDTSSWNATKTDILSYLLKADFDDSVGVYLSSYTTLDSLSYYYRKVDMNSIGELETIIGTGITSAAELATHIGISDAHHTQTTIVAGDALKSTLAGAQYTLDTKYSAVGGIYLVTDSLKLKLADGSLTLSGSGVQVTADLYQPLDAQLTDLADGIITGNFQNTAYPWGSTEIVATVMIEGENASLLVNDSGWTDDAPDDNFIMLGGIGATVVAGDSLLIWDTSTDTYKKVAVSEILADEYLQDLMNTPITGGNQTRIAVTYDDVNNWFEFVVEDMYDNTDTQDLSYDAPTDVISLVDGGSIDISEVDTNTQNDSTATDGLNFVPDAEFTTHKTSSDHDGRYYTEAEVDASIALLLLKTAFDDSVAEYIDDTAYNATSWDANSDAATKNAIRDKIETLGGTGTMTTVKENDVQVGGADIITIDFLGADFDLAETPDTEIQIIINADIARDSEIPGLETNAAVDSEAELEAILGTAWGTSKVNTAGYIWVADGTDFESVVMSGDATIASGGALTIGHNALDDQYFDAHADVDHDQTTNFVAGEHFLQSAIVETGAVNAGSITSGFGAIDNGASNITTTGIGTFGNLLSNSNYAMEGYSTGRNVIRAQYFNIVGNTDATQVTVIGVAPTSEGFNSSAIASEVVDTDTPTGGTRFDISAAGYTITVKAISDVVGVFMGVVRYTTSGTSFSVVAGKSAGKITITCYDASGSAYDFSSLPNTLHISVVILYATST